MTVFLSKLVEESENGDDVNNINAVYYSLPCYYKTNTLFSAVPTVRTTQFIIVRGNPLFSLYYNNIPSKRILTASKLSIFHNGCSII